MASSSNKISKLVIALAAVVLAMMGILGYFFGWSFVVGKRKFYFVHGDDAKIIGAFWAYIALFFVVMFIKNPVMRRMVNIALSTVLVCVLVGGFAFLLFAPH